MTLASSSSHQVDLTMENNLYFNLVSRSVSILDAHVTDNQITSSSFRAPGEIKLRNELAFGNFQGSSMFRVKHEGYPFESSGLAVHVWNSSFHVNTHSLFELEKTSLFMNESKVTVNESLESAQLVSQIIMRNQRLR